MGKKHFFSILAFVTAANPCPADVAGFEYWLDDDADARTYLQTRGDVELQLDVSDLAKGMHRYNFRVIDEHGRSGAVYSMDFVCLDDGLSDGKISEIEYWIDGRISSMQTTAIQSDETIIEIDAPETPGLHTITISGKDSMGRRGHAIAGMYVASPPTLADNTLTAYNLQSVGGKAVKTSIEPDASFGPEDIWFDLSDEFAGRMSQGYSIDWQTPAIEMSGMLSLCLTFEDSHGLQSLPEIRVTDVETSFPIEFRQIEWNETINVEDSCFPAYGFKLHDPKGNPVTWQVSGPCVIDLYDADGEMTGTLVFDDNELSLTTGGDTIFSFAIMHSAKEPSPVLICMSDDVGVEDVNLTDGKVTVHDGKVTLSGFRDCVYDMSLISGISYATGHIETDDVSVYAENGTYIITLYDNLGHRLMIRKILIR